MALIDTMTATDWRRVYERTQEYASDLLRQGVALRRRELELADRLRRREEHVRELEAENQRLRDALDHIDAASREDWGGPDHEDVFTQWREAVTRARDIAKEGT